MPNTIPLEINVGCRASESTGGAEVVVFFGVAFFHESLSDYDDIFTN